jgi:hypothetical protein
MATNNLRDHQRPPDDRRAEALDELRQIKTAIRDLQRTLDSFAGILLNGLLPYGRPTDKWGRHD